MDGLFVVRLWGNCLWYNGCMDMIGDFGVNEVMGGCWVFFLLVVCNFKARHSWDYLWLLWLLWFLMCCQGNDFSFRKMV